jgi:hypothetical protein
VRNVAIASARFENLCVTGNDVSQSVKILVHQDQWDVAKSSTSARMATPFLTKAATISVGGSSHGKPAAGLTAEGDTPGATGVAQCVELFRQLPGEAANQGDGARIALPHNVGRPTAASAVTILEGPGANGG